MMANDMKPLPQTVVILLGPPGSGKGTQALRLTKELNIPHISTGDLFRENVSKATALGEEAKHYMDAGQLVPDELVLRMLFDRISRSDCSHGYLLDGVPRTISQAEALENYFKNVQPKVIDLMVSDEMIVKRLTGRLSCKSCGSIYNKYFSPPKKEGICDKCQAPLSQRTDDRDEVVKERLKVYRIQTEPLIHFYEQKNLLNRIEGERDPDRVFKELRAKF
jgi:adenylate kinase